MSTNNPKVGHPMQSMMEDITPVEDWMLPWLGEWTYIIKNQVHSFDITANSNGKLMYTENMGMTAISGRVNVNEETRSARIVARGMNFEIDINREKMVARYRTIGSSKWTKEIDLMKVDEIDTPPLSNNPSKSLSWNKKTLRNTWTNTSLSRGPSHRADKNHLKPGLTDHKSLTRESTANSLRGCSIRKLNSLKYCNAGETPSVKSEELDELVKRNTSRRSIRFAPGVKGSDVSGLDLEELRKDYQESMRDIGSFERNESTCGA